jgi:hypothetical protein
MKREKTFGKTQTAFFNYVLPDIPKVFLVLV